MQQIRYAGCASPVQRCSRAETVRTAPQRGRPRAQRLETSGSPLSSAPSVIEKRVRSPGRARWLAEHLDTIDRTTGASRSPRQASQPW